MSQLVLRSLQFVGSCLSGSLGTSQVSTCLAGFLLSCFELSLSVLQCLLGVGKLGCVIVSLGTVRCLSKVNLIKFSSSLVDGIKIWLERCLLLVVLVNSSLVSRSPGTIWISIVTDKFTTFSNLLLKMTILISSTSTTTMLVKPTKTY